MTTTSSPAVDPAELLPGDLRVELWKWRLRIILRMKNLYSGAIDEKDGRNRVQQFLRRRLNNLYPDLSREEKAAIEEAGSHICEGRGPNGEEKGETGRRECIAFDPSP